MNMTNVSLTGRAGGIFGSIAKRAGLAGIAFVTLAVASTANATPTTTEARPATLRMRQLADNVVVSPGGGTAPAATPAPAAPQTVVVPQGGSAPAAAAPAEPTKRTNVHADVEGPKNYMSTIAVSALMGGLAGGLIGGAIYFLGDRNDGINIAYWAAGGVLVGTGVGVTQVLVQESRVSNVAASRFQSDPAPTYRLALLRLKF
jgi:hypothetical protein